MGSIGVIGCGAWATTIAKVLAENNQITRIWCHRRDYVTAINKGHMNSLALPNILLPPALVATSDPAEIAECADWIVCIPSKFFSSLNQFIPHSSNKKILSLVKGIPSDSFTPASETIESLFNTPKIAVLSGPNLAAELSQKKPAASVVASSDSNLADHFQSLLSNDYFRIYTSTDRRGVELGGILKNIYAIGAGIVDGLALGANAKSALLSRSVNEMSRILGLFGANSSTCYGLSGIGDLVATSYSNTSRNWQFGFGLTQSHQPTINGIVEGERTLKCLIHSIPMPSVTAPIAESLHTIISGNVDIKTAIDHLFARRLTAE
ncbi:NAD(P)H-dependent glycerol-3-phosphate dehydrogenase [bacterium]|nr:NAD(P)H-dependent glycerol-3-phosphate dehydrogenase [bacterium]